MPTDNSDAPVVEGELVEETPTAVSQTMDLTGLINNYLNQIAVLEKQAFTVKEMLDSAYENDSTYQLHDTAVKEATKIRSQTKKQIQKQPQVADLVARTVDHKTSLKELRNQLSDYLQEYAKTTGSTQFEDATGEVRQIVYQAKLVRKP
jgi:hypothetical protein